MGIKNGNLIRINKIDCISLQRLEITDGVLAIKILKRVQLAISNNYYRLLT